MCTISRDSLQFPQITLEFDMLPDSITSLSFGLDGCICLLNYHGHLLSTSSTVSAMLFHIEEIAIDAVPAEMLSEIAHDFAPQNDMCECYCLSMFPQHTSGTACQANVKRYSILSISRTPLMPQVPFFSVQKKWLICFILVPRKRGYSFC